MGVKVTVGVGVDEAGGVAIDVAVGVLVDSSGVNVKVIIDTCVCVTFVVLFEGDGAADAILGVPACGTSVLSVSGTVVVSSLEIAILGLRKPGIPQYHPTLIMAISNSPIMAANNHCR